jgi:glycosidase
MAHTFVMSQPDQIPLIYYGDEFGLTGAGDPDNRRMMKFGKDVPPNGRAVMDHVAKLTKLRKQHRALRTGDTTVLHEAGDLLVLLRSTAQERLVVAFNRKPTRETLSVRLPAWAVDGAVSLPKMLLGDKGTSVKAEGKKDSFGLTMPPRSSAIFIFEP